MVAFEDNFWEGNGFEEVKKLTSKGNDAIENIMDIIVDRLELSKDYAKGLTKIASKAESLNKEYIGTLKDAWGEMKISFELEAKWHTQTAERIQTEITSLMKSFHKEHKKARKPIEAKVDKAYSEYQDAKSSESKARKSSYSKCKDFELAYDQYGDAKQGKGRVYSDKDLAKLDKAARKSEETANKADKEHRQAVKKLEQMRKKWEEIMIEGCREMEALEHQRVSHLKEILTKYVEIISSLPNDFSTLLDRLTQMTNAIDPDNDVSSAAEMKGTGATHPKELLYEAFEEDPQHQMKPDRRERRLDEKVRELDEELRKEEKTLVGVRGLADVYNNQPNFADDKGKQNVQIQIAQAERSVASAQITLYKVHSSLQEFTGQPKSSHPYAQYMEKTRDSSGNTLVYFSLPSNMAPVDASVNVNIKPRSATVASASSTSSTPHSSAVSTPQVDDTDGFEYRALYDYDASKEDELTIREGDVLVVVQQYEGGWWLCRNSDGQEGLLPENYLGS